MASENLNIHIKLGYSLENYCIAANAKLTECCPENKVELHNRMQPHITLYLTSFTDPEAVISKLKALAPTLKRTMVTPKDIETIGAFGMWFTDLNSEMQALSDDIVNATKEFIVPNQPVPEWVKHLPEPMRSKKIHYIKAYGSPNVFDQFQPHITLGWDDTEGSNLDKCLQEMNLQGFGSITMTVAVGVVGPYGTVLRGEDLASFPIGF
eukprot:TRINITY_DN2941_c0_g1_i1.p1 TRINITY_DN2941_c0_g1~~TRINITY_DN2941_c0_g1_i1.p1  ORF type:complete len:226 (+),score=59.64 TRINITY_DN2941_c0_g1_i1:54-680(+)